MSTRLIVKCRKRQARESAARRRTDAPDHPRYARGGRVRATRLCEPASGEAALRVSRGCPPPPPSLSAAPPLRCPSLLPSHLKVAADGSLDALRGVAPAALKLSLGTSADCEATGREHRYGVQGAGSSKLVSPPTSPLRPNSDEASPQLHQTVQYGPSDGQLGPHLGPSPASSGREGAGASF